MHSTDSSVVALAPQDRDVLSRRQGFLGRMMNYAYLLLALFLIGFVVKDLLVYRAFVFENIRELLMGVALFGVSLGLTQAAIAWFERNLRRTLRTDLASGMKIRRYGTLLGVQESAESEPTRFQFSAFPSGETEEFALPGIADLLRIKPGPLVGKSVELEYAPASRIVLLLREVPAPSVEPHRIRASEIKSD